MIKNSIIKQNMINVIVFTICILLILTGNHIITKISKTKEEIKNNIEIEWRQQAKRTLFNLQEQFMYDVRHGVLDPTDELQLQEWAKRNISGILNGGPTGDAFMINLSDEKFIWDGSPDCAKPEFITNGRYMKDEAEMHVNPEQAESILNKMRLGISTINTYEKNWWNFDGSPELLEWVVIPPGFSGFNYEPITIGGVKNPNYNKILIALGTQQDEIESLFENTFSTLDTLVVLIKIFVTISIILCIFNMIIYVFLSKNTKE